MKNIPKVIYLLCTVLVLTLILTFASGNQVNESVLRGDSSFQILSDYEVNAYKNEDAPIGITQVYKCSLNDIPAYNGCVTFYIVHQEVDAYLDDELVYQFKIICFHSRAVYLLVLKPLEVLPAAKVMSLTSSTSNIFMFSCILVFLSP